MANTDRILPVSAPSPSSQPQRSPASFRQGWQWLAHAADFIAQRPLIYLPAVAWLLLVGSLQWLVPGASAFLSGFLAPLSIAPLLGTFATHYQDQRISWFSGFYVLQKNHLLPLLRLGVYLSLVVLLLSQISGWLMALILPQELLDMLAQQDLKYLIYAPKHYLMLILALTALPMAALGFLAWYSIPLVLFQQAAIPNVLWISIKTCILNYWALMAVSLLLIVVVLGASIILFFVTALGTAIAPIVGYLADIIIIILGSAFLQSALVGAQYLSFQHQQIASPHHQSP